MPPAKHQKPAILSGVSVLVVDDSTNARRLLKSLLMAFGVDGDDLWLAADGPSALTMLADKAPDLIICDWNMAPMDGIEFLRHLRHRDTPAARTPTIMLTAHTNPALVKASMEAGANHFVAKPIVPANLLKRIQWAREDKRIYLMEGDHYVLREPVAVIPPLPAALPPARKAVKRRRVWEV